MALTDNLLAFYKLSDLLDSTGNNRNLTNNGNVTFASGKIGNAAVFDGQSHLTLESVPADGTNDLSVGMWMNLTNIDSDQKVVYAGGSGGFTFSVLEGILHIAQSNVADLYDFSSVAVTNNSWFHVLVKRTGSLFNCYINGASVGTYDSGSVIDFTGTDYYVGAHPGPMLFVEGQIDAVGIWNRALSDAEVAELYNNGTGLELGRYRGEWDNFAYYGEGDIVTLNGLKYMLAHQAGWTVGGSPALGYGWQRHGSFVKLGGTSKLSGRIKIG